MGKLAGYKQTTMYVEENLYERVRFHAYAFGEDIYEFVDEALRSAIERRTTSEQRDVISAMVKQNLKNGNKRAKESKRAKRR